MFCYQCEQTAGGTGCTRAGVCGKDAVTAALQDLLLYATQGIAQYAHRAAVLGVRDSALDVFTVQALFSTITNVNFDPERLKGLLSQAAVVRDTARSIYQKACAAKGTAPEVLAGPAVWKPAGDLDGLVAQGREIGWEKLAAAYGPDITGSIALLTFGLKGVAAYAEHAHMLGQDDSSVYDGIYRALDYLATPGPALDRLLALVDECGKINLRVMELLDAANCGAYGPRVPTAVRITPVKGKAILVSGHTLKDLDALLQQTAGKGINVYTHGEMLPAHGYSKLKAHSHLAGNYGGAWQDQRKEFDAFPGPIVMTTNCIQRPAESYKARIYTTGLVAWPGVTHIANRNFADVIEAALKAPGFAAAEPEKTILVGFGHEVVLGVAGQVIAAVKAGDIKHFFLIGGCDGAKSGRNYFTDFAQAVPKDCVILTLACGKYRFNKLDFGTVAGLPRLLDCGQCNDAYSAIKVAGALAGAFNCTVNELPLSMILSWYEQKAVCILLTLLHLGIRNIRLGPTLPAFVTPAMLKLLVDKFAIKPITTVEADMKAALSGN
ncbi:MAG: hydroxylamine reductase [bacterium]